MVKLRPVGIFLLSRLQTRPDSSTTCEIQCGVRGSSTHFTETVDFDEFHGCTNLARLLSNEQQKAAEAFLKGDQHTFVEGNAKVLFEIVCRD